eukprot:6600016-Pyramimonas_sp.AAC.1
MRVPTRGQAHSTRKITRPPLGQHQRSPRRRVTPTCSRPRDTATAEAQGMQPAPEPAARRGEEPREEAPEPSRLRGPEGSLLLR